MAKYTVQVKSIIESLGSNTTMALSTLDEQIEKARPKIFDFEYPFYDPSSKADFETWILECILMDEINYETYGLWHLKLRTFMKTNMPYYNKLYESAKLITDPLKNHHLERTTEGSENGNSTSNGEGNSTSKGTSVNNDKSTSNLLAWNMYADTPQGGIDGLENSTYLTNATKDLSDTTNTSNSNGTTTNETDSTSKNETTSSSNSKGKELVDGYSGIDVNTLLLKYRQTIININEQFINDFKSKLTLKLWY